MAKRKRTKGQTTIDKQRSTKSGVNPGAPEGERVPALLAAPVVLIKLQPRFIKKNKLKNSDDYFVRKLLL